MDEPLGRYLKIRFLSEIEGIFGNRIDLSVQNVRDKGYGIRRIQITPADIRLPEDFSLAKAIHMNDHKFRRRFQVLAEVP